MYNKGNSQLAEKLSNIRSSIHTNFTLPAAHTIGRDGVDHVNIWEKSSTEFGIVLDQFQDTPFEHPMYGRFRSIDGFWHYLRSPTRDDRNRAAFGKRIKNNNDQTFERVENFRYIIMDATWHKVNQYPALVEEMKRNKLPFDMYLLHNNNPNVRIRPKAAFWMVPGMEEIRKAICENRRPDFDFLLDEPGSTPPDLSGNYVKHRPAKLTGMFTAKPKEENRFSSAEDEKQPTDINHCTSLVDSISTKDKKKGDTLEVNTMKDFDNEQKEVLGVVDSNEPCIKTMQAFDKEQEVVPTNTVVVSEPSVSV